MGPKAEPKKTKAELRAEAEAEAARLAEIEEAERLERERVAAEQYAAAQVMRRELMQMCEEELSRQYDAELEAKNQREAEFLRHSLQQAEVADWEAFLNPSHLPSVQNEADINSFIAELCVPDNAAEPLTQAVVQADDVLFLADQLAQESRRTKHADAELSGKFQRFRRLLLRHLMDNLDATCHMMLKQRDKYTIPASGSSVASMQHWSAGKHIGVGFWVNVAKNIRQKMIVHSALGLATDIPRPIITTNVALRMIHFECDPLTELEDKADYSVGGVLAIDMLKMPELGVQVRGWKMRQILESDESAVIAEYGPVDPDTGLREKVPLVKVVYRLRDDVLLPSMTGCDHIRIGRFSHASNAFSTDDIFNVELLRGVEAKECLDKLVASESAPSLQKDKDDKRPVTSDALGGAADETAQGGASDDVAVITFNTHWLGSFALLQAVSSNLPYRSWRIYPQLMTQADSSGLPATGADDPGAVAIAFEVDLPWTTIHMRVTAEGCMLARPIQTPGQDLHQCTTARHLTALVGQSQPAGVLLGRLREAGLLLSPTDALAPLVSCATKDRAMQADVASGVSMIAAGYHISSAALNKQLSHTSASIMIAPADQAATLPTPGALGTHWTQSPPAWAKLCVHGHIEFQCQQGCNAPPPKTGGRPVTSKSTKSAKSDKSVGADAEGGADEPGLSAAPDASSEQPDDQPVTAEGQESSQKPSRSLPPAAWGEQGLEACFCDGWDTVLFRQEGEAKFEIPDRLRGCVIMQPPVCPAEPLDGLPSQATGDAAVAAPPKTAASKGDGKGKRPSLAPPEPEIEVTPPAEIVQSTRQRAEALDITQLTHARFLHQLVDSLRAEDPERHDAAASRAAAAPALLVHHVAELFSELGLISFQEQSPLESASGLSERLQAGLIDVADASEEKDKKGMVGEEKEGPPAESVANNGEAETGAPDATESQAPQPETPATTAP